MPGAAIFLAFFTFFTLATLAVAVPLFPGSIVHSVFSSSGVSVSLNFPLLCAGANGLCYGFVVWIVFVLVSRKLEESEAVIDASAQVLSLGVPCPVHFGYLRKLQPGSSVPEECYSCHRIEACLNS